MQLKDVWVCNEEALPFKDDQSIVYPVGKKDPINLKNNSVGISGDNYLNFLSY